MLTAIPRWKELGTERWVMETEKRFTCSYCGSLLHRYANLCNRCQKPTDFLK
jgi:predicted amidophosphoribosyltransferase